LHLVFVVGPLRAQPEPHPDVVGETELVTLGAGRKLAVLGIVRRAM
jgi:hypothetical protein